MENRASEKAFKWIVGILENHNLPFQITGGLAARAYGSRRPLNDIDIDISDDGFYQILPDVRGYVIFGPERFVDEHFDLLLMTLRYAGQEIDISGGDTIRIPDGEGYWHDAPTDFSKLGIKDIFGISVPVMVKEEVLKYKKLLDRPVDREDIQALEKDY